jgi:hypothetical protein
MTTTSTAEKKNAATNHLSDDKITGLVTELKRAIADMAEKTENARAKIKDLARLLDESGQCEKRNEISRKIKEPIEG